MAYGTKAFTDGYGDYKQPTVLDYDQEVNNTFVKPPTLSSQEIEEYLKQLNTDKESVLSKVLLFNPVYGGAKYNHLTQAINGKLVWNTVKIQELKEDLDWLYEFYRYLKNREKKLSNT